MMRVSKTRARILCVLLSDAHISPKHRMRFPRIREQPSRCHGRFPLLRWLQLLLVTTAPSHFSLVTRPLVIWKCNKTVTGHGYLQNAALAAQATDPLLQSRKQWNPRTLLIIYTACRPACMHINCSQLTGGKWFKSVHLCVERAINMTLYTCALRKFSVQFYELRRT
jgi:hypothetical protein